MFVDDLPPSDPQPPPLWSHMSVLLSNLWMGQCQQLLSCLATNDGAGMAKGPLQITTHGHRIHGQTNTGPSWLWV
jgi:hypothetical protein